MHVAIVGGGPAGAMAAIRLARAGASVTIFDASHPREKPCGGGVTGRALALIADVVDIASMPAVMVKAAIVEEPDTTDVMSAVTVRLPPSPGPRRTDTPTDLVVISREIFDKALLDAAVRSGAQLIAEKVTDISRLDRAWSVRTAHRAHAAELLLGADGAGGIVRKKVARPFLPSEISLAAGYFVHGISAPDIAIQSMTQQPGYLWSFPRPDHLAVGVCAPAGGSTTSNDLRRQSLAWIHSHHNAGAGCRLEPYAWPIPSAGFNTAAGLCLAGPGWMLLGDAAGLVDPLTREGIYYALLSGAWAAEAIAARGASRPEAVYADRVRHEIYPELARAARLSGLFFSPGFSRLFVSALRESAAIRAVFRDLVAGTQPYRGLRRRLLATREWKLAGRALQLVVQ
ncbi:MAG TPA: geranylgeranyl reductase family protein [Vicinamibacterales bacterium]|nr:geranylgeranyl reductase family protein [Vicinamibacterales bacterium]